MRSRRTIYALTATALIGVAVTMSAAPAFAQMPTNVCYTNHLSDAEGNHEAWIGHNHLLYGQTACFTYSSSKEKEIKFYTNKKKDPTIATFTAHNPLIGKPWVGITPDETVHKIHLDENETKTYVDTRWEMSYTVHRKTDAAFAKEFTVDIKIH